ncbi:hypothetical protein FSP39_012665 [Pinctada imbricata]|uniref:MYND-type domain-containing protein n=1 Tax=Pinctada imbricata TaxID=66713 RepID=A0AA89BMA0_PINIB|nr:hypothetical protein FSP39_012665 [Pinctada imbricata]
METVDNSEAADSSEEMETVTSLCESTGLVLSVKVPKRTLNVKVPQTAQSEDKPQGTNESSIATTKGVEVDTDSQHTDGAKTKSDTDVTDTAPSPKKKRDEPRSDLEITEWESGRKSPIYDKSPVYNKKSNSSEDAPRPPSSSTTELSSQFFQTAVEKTLNPPTTTSPSMMKPPQPTKVPAKPTEDDVQVINDSYRNSEQTQNASNMTCLSSPTSTSSAAILVQDDEIEDRVTSGPSGSRSGKQDGQSNIPAGARNLVSKFSAKFTAVMQETFEEMCTEFVQSELQKPKERDTSYDAEISRLEWEQKQQLVELKHNFQLALAEMKSCWAAENLRIVSDLKATLTKEKDQAVNDTKKKQWCANCGKEAIFYCCWNTSYCDYPCQQAHWPTHMPNCMQTQNSSNENEGEKDNNQSKSSSNNTSPQGPSNQSNQSTAPSQPVGNHGPTRPDNQENVDDFRHRVRENFTNVLRQQHQGPHPPPPHPTPQGMPYLPPGANMPQHNFMPVQPGPRPEDMGGMTRYPVPPWTDQNMDAAFRAVIKEGMSVNKAAKVFKVPRHKLTERLGARTSTAPNMQALTGNQPLAGNHPVQFQYVGQPTTLMPPGVQHLNSQQQVTYQKNFLILYFYLHFTSP